MNLSSPRGGGGNDIVTSSSEQSTRNHLKGHTIIKGKQHMIRLARQRYRTAIDCIIQFDFSIAVSWMSSG